MGKTSYAMNLAEHAAIKEEKAVAVFSMEMPGESLAMRLMSSLGRISQQRVRTGQLEDEDWPRITSAVVLLSQAKLFIDDSPGLSPTELRARCRRLKREHDLGMVVVDYLPYGAFPAYFYLFAGLAFKLRKGKGVNFRKAIYPYFLGQVLLSPLLVFERKLNLAMQTLICRRS